jgi:hypothetical protein
MASRRIIQFVRLDSSSQGRLSAVGGVHPDGRFWQLSTEAAILGIERAEWTFYVESSGELLLVGFRADLSGVRYLSIDGGEAEDERLLSLPAIPS